MANIKLDNFRVAIMALNAAIAELKNHGLEVLSIKPDYPGMEVHISNEHRFVQVFPDCLTIPRQSTKYPYELVAELGSIKFIALCPAEAEKEVG
jgi:hypothetical protein